MIGTARGHVPGGFFRRAAPPRRPSCARTPPPSRRCRQTARADWTDYGKHQHLTVPLFERSRAKSAHEMCASARIDENGCSSSVNDQLQAERNIRERTLHHGVDEIRVVLENAARQSVNVENARTRKLPLGLLAKAADRRVDEDVSLLEHAQRALPVNSNLRFWRESELPYTCRPRSSD